MSTRQTESGDFLPVTGEAGVMPIWTQAMRALHSSIRFTPGIRSTKRLSELVYWDLFAAHSHQHMYKLKSSWSCVQRVFILTVLAFQVLNIHGPWGLTGQHAKMGHKTPQSLDRSWLRLSQILIATSKAESSSLLDMDKPLQPHHSRCHHQVHHSLINRPV